MEYDRVEVKRYWNRAKRRGVTRFEKESRIFSLLDLCGTRSRYTRSISTIPGTRQNTGYLHGECKRNAVFRTDGECTVSLYSLWTMESTVQSEVTECAW